LFKKTDQDHQESKNLDSRYLCLEWVGDQCGSSHFGTKPLLFKKTGHDYQESEP